MSIDPKVWLQHAWLNRLQSLALLAVMAGFLGLLGWLVWGGSGIVMLLTVGVMGALFTPAIPPRLVMRLYRATPVRPDQAPEVWHVVAVLSERAGLPVRPELYYIPSRMLNAFAVGSDERAAIAVTDGMLRQLSLREIAGVLAHEISHIRNNDLWVMGLADLFSRVTSVLSLIGQLLLLVNLPLVLFADLSINWFAILLLVFAPGLSALAQLALSRTREYNADLNAARLTGDPEGLARALTRIERLQGTWWERILMPGRRVPEPSLLRTHPETGERVARLMALKPELTPVAVWPAGRSAFDAHPVLGPPVARSPRWHIGGLWY